MVAARLHWVDWLVFAIFLVASITIGLFHALTGGKQQSTREFILANRQLKVIPTALSMLVSYQSAIMILGHTAEMYLYSSQAWLWELVGFTLAILMGERVIVPWLYPLKLTSINEYLEMRFKSRLIRMIGSILAIANGVLYMGSAMFAPSLALEAVTGLPMSLSIALMALVCTTYTALGGMRAVIWTDVLQFILMVGGALAILVVSLIRVGGLSGVLEICEQENRIMWADFDPNPTKRQAVWTFLIGWSTTWCFIYSMMQFAVQRYSALPSLEKARICMLLNIPGLLIMVTVVCLLGLTTFAYYTQQGCDPLAGHRVSNPNQILPLFMMDVFSSSPGFAGLFLASLYSGALSTVSSSLSAAAANTWEDLLKRPLHKFSERKAAMANRVLVIVYGGLATAFAFIAAGIDAPITQIATSMIGAVSGPKAGLYLLGGLLAVANWKGAFGGVLFGIGFNLWVNIGAFSVRGRHNFPLPPGPTDNCTNIEIATNSSVSLPDPVTGIEKLYTLSYMYNTLLGVAVTIFFGAVISVFTRQTEKDDIPSCLLIDWKNVCSWSPRPDPEQPHQHKLYSVNREKYDKTQFDDTSSKMLPDNTDDISNIYQQGKKETHEKECIC